ncbi:protein MpCache3 [Marchantia polymorpha subsp. ruderalis]|uniref:Histidine kinase n=2 Tax=Marchantia polymorpha TaxID=3197 RepID=A0AAF6BUT0_MARPO|nr:hypothetical protein MARPO_0046s0066 [Marchantia polymorpha]BBN15764.1 hypothetical protein Mp_7g00590 [Marchantia polymorpha subsp. ruderalis]|eukprot:PTQ39244.1 hypothetical protein MARPO_0046s0066 [Marchantia polymorpha]
MWTMYKGIVTMEESTQEANGEEEANLANELPRPRLQVTRAVIMTMLLMLVGLLAFCVWFFAYSAPRLSGIEVMGLTASLRKEILDSTVEILDEVFRWNAYGARALAGMLERDLLGDGSSLESFEKIRAASFSVFKAIPLITSIGATNINGLTGLHVRGGLNPTDRDTGKTAPIYIYTKSTDSSPSFYIENLDMDTGDAVGSPLEFQFREHFTERKWFHAALSVPMGDISWHTSLSQASGRPYIQCSIPVLSKESEEVTVVHCSHSADAITNYLSNALDLKGGNVFVVNDVGEVVFTSEGEHCLNKNTSHSSGCEDNSEVVRALGYIQSQMDVTELVQEEVHRADVLLRGRRYFLDSWPYSFEGAKLAVVVMIPRHSFSGPMDSHTRLAWIAIPLFVAGSSFVGFLLIFLLMGHVAADIKLRAELQRQVEAKRRAEASRDAKTAFLSHMSHELRTPMACIIGLLEILMQDLKMSEHLSSVRQVHRCATSLVDLLNSALDIAKVEAGKLVLEVKEFDIETELTNLIEVFSVTCDTKGLHLALELSDDIPKLVKGDPARVNQIFTNLVGNSIKFTSKGRIIVRGWVDTRDTEPTEFTTTALETGKNQVVLTFEVDDTGPGIEEDLRERVFENFVQGAVSVPRTHGGTGLGLGIVRSLVNLMGGEIHIGDKAGDGTVFRFSLCFDLPPDQKSSRREILKRPDVILGMPDTDCRSVVAKWMEDRRIPVLEVSSWEDVLLLIDVRRLAPNGWKLDERAPALRKDDAGGEFAKPRSSPARHTGPVRRARSAAATNDHRKPVLIIDVDLCPLYEDENDYLLAFEQLGLISIRSNQQGQEEAPGHLKQRIQFCQAAKFHAIIWVMASYTPDSLKKALYLLCNATCRSLLVRRPLHPTRLRELFSELEFREQSFQTEGRSAVTLRPANPGPSPVNIGKQCGLGTYDSDVDSCLTKGVPVEGATRAPDGSPALETTTDTAAPLTSSPETSKAEVERVPQNPLIRTNSDDAQKYVGKSEQLVATKPLRGLSVLITEDHGLLRKVGVTMLAKLGATPSLACNGREAVEAVVSRFESGAAPFDCILMDCQMPIMNGYDACKAIRKFEGDKDQRTCIVALTANAMASDEERCFQAGMDAFLSKPMTQEKLVQVMLASLKQNASNVIEVT